MPDLPILKVELTREQQLEILATTGLRVTTLELPVEAVAEGGEAVARLPLPEWLRNATVSSPEGKEVGDDDRETRR